jgi:hypothetical protein
MSAVRVRHRPPSCFALTRFAGLSLNFGAKQDALRSFSEEGPIMYFVYLIESEHDPTRRYIGLTSDLRQRLQEHNAGKSTHTAKYLP